MRVETKQRISVRDFPPRGEEEGQVEERVYPREGEFQEHDGKDVDLWSILSQSHTKAWRGFEAIEVLISNSKG